MGMHGGFHDWCARARLEHLAAAPSRPSAAARASAPPLPAGRPPLRRPAHRARRRPCFSSHHPCSRSPHGPLRSSSFVVIRLHLSTFVRLNWNPLRTFSICVTWKASRAGMGPRQCHVVATWLLHTLRPFTSSYKSVGYKFDALANFPGTPYSNFWGHPKITL